MDGRPSTGPGLGRGDRDAAGEREGPSVRRRGLAGVSPAGRISFRVTAGQRELCRLVQSTGPREGRPLSADGSVSWAVAPALAAVAVGLGRVPDAAAYG